MLESVEARLGKKKLATFDHVDAAMHCPELFLPCWRDLAQTYQGDAILPFLLQIHVYEDGTVAHVHVAFRLTDRQMLDSDPLENPVDIQPFGKGPQAAQAAREYVERKEKEIEAWQEKEQEMYRVLAPFVGAKGRRKKRR